MSVKDAAGIHLAAELGANQADPNGQASEERVKVDRKKFEQMLNEGSTLGCDADSFFRQVMRSTNTQIMWPPKLKPGTKSKKDPHVRITGSPNSINAAKEIIFEQLDTRRNRVTLKMDVAFTDHSHIIGKGGRSIQRVMDETGCHIHFPDSNRTNTAEKSNQVSIAGSAEGVEQSRCRIREMLPITLQFDLPLNNGLHSPPTLDPQSPQLQAIQQSYGITITFRCDGSKCNNNSYFASSRIITVAVRGARSHLFGLRQGLSVLIEYLTGYRANTINVPLTMTIDVAVQHHSFIAGRANSNVRSIMQSTGAAITMPDLSGTPLATTSSSTSIGSLGSLNLTSSSSTSALTGSVPNINFETGNMINSSASSSSLATLQDAAASHVNSSSPITSLTLGTSTSLGDLTSICNQQASLSSSSSFMASSGLLSSQALRGSNPNLALAQSSAAANNNNTSNSNTNISTSNLSSVSLNNSTNNNNNSSSSSIIINNNNSSNSRKTAIFIKGPNFESVYSAWQELLGYLPLILIFDLKEGQDLDAVQVTRLMEQMRQISILIKPKQRQNTKSIVVRGPEKDSRLLFEVRKQILRLDDSEVQSSYLTLQHKTLACAQHQQQQQSQASSQHQQPSHQIEQQHQQHQTPHQPRPLQQQSTNQQLPVGFGQQTQHMQASQLASKTLSAAAAEMQMKAIRAILEPNLEKSRQPTPYWAGQGFSKSVSEPLIKSKTASGPLFASNLSDERRISYSNENTMNDLAASLQSMTSNASSSHSCGQTQTQTNKTFTDANNNIDIPSVNNNQKISSCLRLAVFLGRIGLVQYLGLFTQHDIDLEMLFSLTENDFAELGLPYMHRRKLTIAIAEVKSSIQNERASSARTSLASTFDAAPGAERSKRQKARCSIQEELSDIWSM